ncbi:hypothetical protein [Knoellia sp. LjRoot47]|uniref:hypothetical protein n=1 Tax=Knoellia sp. LjRoot47 TaxID=3342330 RepID=UPI003ECD82F9
MDGIKVEYDRGSVGLRLSGEVVNGDGRASYRAILRREAATTLGGLLRSGDWKVDESFDFDDVDGDVAVNGQLRSLDRVNVYRFALSADLSLHVDFLQPGDASGEPSGNLHVAEVRDPGPALLGKIRGCHEIGVTEPELVLAILRSNVSLDEVQSLQASQPLADLVDGLKTLAALREDDVPVRLAEDGQSILLDLVGSP